MIPEGDLYANRQENAEIALMPSGLVISSDQNRGGSGDDFGGSQDASSSSSGQARADQVRHRCRQLLYRFWLLVKDTLEEVSPNLHDHINSSIENIKIVHELLLD